MLKNLLAVCHQTARRTRLRLAGVEIGPTRLLGRGIDCRRGVGENGAGRIDIADGAWIDAGVMLHAFGGAIRIGRNVFIGPHAVIYGHGTVEIGDACLIAMHCSIVSSNHTVAPLGTDIRSLPDVLLPTKIGRDVWLGAGVTVLGGITIGAGTIVGAGAVVTHDLPAGSIARGVPARVVGERQ